jgi:hypothetical protein
VIPKTVKVGPHVYSILRKSKAEMKDHGLCDWDQVQIKIQERLRKSKAQEVLLHEVLHACCYPNMADVQNKTDEEFVDTVSPLLLQVLRDNPELVEYLIG